MIHRSLVSTVTQAARTQSLTLVDALPGSGRSTLARQLAAALPGGATVLDGRSAEARKMVSEAIPPSPARAVIMDDADEARAAGVSSALEAWKGGGKACPRFILIGGPFSGDRRPAHLRLEPFTLFEVGRTNIGRLWLRGGFPEAYAARDDEAALAVCARRAADLAYTILRGFGLGLDPDAVFRLMELAAVSSGEAMKVNAAARELGVSRPAVARAVPALADAGIIRLLPSLSPAETGRSLASPAISLRDTGLMHALLGIRGPAELALREKAASASWRACAVEQACAVLPDGLAAGRYRSADGACLDLVIHRLTGARPDPRPVAAAIARPRSGEGPGRGASGAATRLGVPPGSRFLVKPSGPRVETGAGFTIIGLPEFLELVRNLDPGPAGA